MDFPVGQFVHCNNDANAQNRNRQCYCSLKLLSLPGPGEPQLHILYVSRI